MNQILQQVALLIQYVQSNAQNLNQATQQAIAQLLEQVMSLFQPRGDVEDLGPEIAQEPELNQGMPSSNVNSFGYDPENQRLLVKFNGKDDRDDGSVYGYDGVPQVIFDLFQSGAIPARTDGQNKWGKWWKGKVPSLGASLYTLINQGGYSYQKLT